MKQEIPDMLEYIH